MIDSLISLVSTNTAIFYFCCLTLYPLSRYVLPKIKSRDHAAILHLILGIAESFILFGKDTLIGFIVCLLPYLALRKTNTKIAFIVNIICLFSSQFYISFLGNDWALDITCHTMIVFIKIWAFICSIKDGKDKSEGKTLKREQWNLMAIEKMPSLTYYLSYLYTPYGSFSNPFIDYNLFIYLLDTGKRDHSKLPEKDQKRAWMRYICSFPYAIIISYFMSVITYDCYLSDWYLGLPIPLRIIASMILTILTSARYFACWFAIEAGFYEAGLGSSGLIDFYGISNLNFIDTLTSGSVAEWLRRWNHTTHLFWKNNLFTRLLNAGYGHNFASFAVLASSLLWHGFKANYFLVLPELFVISQCDALWDKLITPNTSKFIKYLKMFYVLVSMLYTTSSWYYPSTQQFIYVRKTLGFVPFILNIVVGIICYIMLIQRKKGNKKTGESENAKKNC